MLGPGAHSVRKGAAGGGEARGDGGTDSASSTVCPPSHCGLRHLPCSPWKICLPPPFRPASPSFPAVREGVQPAETGPRLSSPSTWSPKGRRVSCFYTTLLDLPPLASLSLHAGSMQWLEAVSFYQPKACESPGLSRSLSLGLFVKGGDASVTISVPFNVNKLNNYFPKR